VLPSSIQIIQTTAIMNINKKSDSFKDLQAKFKTNFDSLFTFTDNHISLKTLWNSAGYKRHAGTPPIQLLILGLYKLIFVPGGSVRGLFDQLLKRDSCSTSRDSFYRFAGNSNINWRRLLGQLVKMLVAKLPDESIDSSKSYSPDFDEKLHNMSFLALDDSTIRKSGRRIEGVTSVHDHTDNSHQVGFKKLALCYMKGSFCGVIDAALVAEKPLNKTGSKTKKLEQFTKKRDHKSPGAKRKKELAKTKIQLAKEMIGRARKKNFQADYVLFDSWFFCLDLVNKICGGSKPSKFVGGIKKGPRKFILDGRELDLKELHKSQKDNRQKNRRFKAHYIEIVCQLPGFGKVKIFCSKFQRSRKWVYLITDDLGLTYEQAVRIYGMRWNIEICFKELKQYLGLGKCQANDFDAQIAHMTSACMLHAIIRFYQTFNRNSTFGELFAEIEDKTHQAHNLHHYWREFKEIIFLLAEILGGAENITVADLFNSSEYAGITDMIEQNLRISLNFGSSDFTQENTLEKVAV
jgi:hypothetical protein